LDEDLKILYYRRLDYELQIFKVIDYSNIFKINILVLYLYSCILNVYILGKNFKGLALQPRDNDNEVLVPIFSQCNIFFIFYFYQLCLLDSTAK